MKISNPNDNKPVAAPTAVGANRPATGSPSKAETTSKQEAAVEASTQVALSKTATNLLVSSDAVSGDFDTAKVARIAQAIADGKFEINPHAIADKLLANAQEVLVKSQH